MRNPMRVPFRTSGSQLGGSGLNQGLNVVSPADFQRITGALRYANAPEQNPLFGQSGVLTQAGGLLNPMRRTETDPEEEFAKRFYGGDGEQDGSIGQRIRSLLSGQSGAAIGGIAQGAGTAIGAYLNRRTERQRFEEEKRRQRIIEENNRRAQELLMPILQSELRRG
jgi:hypothetical protein